MSAATIALVDRLIERCDSLQRLAREHLADNFGEVLPHVFLGDLTRHLLALAALPPDEPRMMHAEAEQLLALLAEEFTSGDDEVKDLISVSFLENLPSEGEAGHRLRSHLGSSLSTELARMQRR